MMATINDPKQIDPKDVVMARTKDPLTEEAQQPESSGLNHQVPVHEVRSCLQYIGVSWKITPKKKPVVVTWR